jgi:EmrB/QacA subfamily drug resistance transporter
VTAARTDVEPIPWTVWRLALVIVFGAFMSGLDASVVNVGLDTVARDLGSDLATAQWVANGYLLALGVSLPLSGWLGRRAGVGRLWLCALAAFTVSSGLCALAGDVGWLIALRVVQGLSAGLLIPAGQTILGQAVGPGRLGRVMSVLGVAVTAAPALGPLVGGLLLGAASWPWLFLINLPLGAAGLALGWRYVPRGEPAAVGRLDLAGLLLVSTGLPLLVYGCTAWGERGTPAAPGVWLPVVAGIGTLTAFVLRSRRIERPVLDLRLFGNRAFAAAVTSTAFTGAALFGAGLLFPLYFLLGRGEDPWTAGVLLISLSVGTMLVLPVSGRLVDRFGGGAVSVAGGIASVLTTAPFALLPLDLPSRGCSCCCSCAGPRSPWR